MPQYIYSKDANFKYQGCNNLVSDYLHLNSPDEIVGKSDYDFGWSEDRINSLYEVDFRVLNEGVCIVVEDIIPRNNENRIMLSSKAPLLDNDDNIIGILGVSTDITDQKNAEEREKKRY